MKYVTIFHANLNYAYLEPHKYEQTIRASYETIIDTFREKCPDARYTFEASGYTIEQIAKLTPDVLKKLKKAIKSGQCEFMGAPYAHPIMANIPEEDGRWSCEFAQRTYEKYLGFRAESFWNPECTWMQYVPRAFRAAGAKYLTLDFESYMNCNDKDYSWVERNRTHDIGWGGHIPWYDLDPDCKFLHQPFRDVVPGLDGMCRSDRLIGKYVGYFLGRLPLEEFVENVRHWSGTKDKGATIIIADDAEYCGTTGYFFVKHYRDYSRSFSVDPNAADKLERMAKAVSELGQMITFKEACQMEPVEEPFFVEDRYAWHRTRADAWAGTPEARAWDPILSDIRKDYRANVQPIVESPGHPEFKKLVDKYWFHLTNSANSDGRWPPPPALTCDFNRQWVLDEIEKTRKTLKQLKRKIKDIPLPPPPPEQLEERDWVYGYPFTDKDPYDVARLNNYELQHAIYFFHKMVDSKDPAKKEEGKTNLRRVFDELDRRGMKGVRPPTIR
ncbi:hypothetical protein GX586_11660 [bacterium]|nr:hypothetical protein [bacterium]